jgi:outer membrane protein assembly factor BamD
MTPQIRFAIIVTVLVAAVTLHGGCSLFQSKEQEVDSVEILLQDGTEAYDKGDYKAALEAFEQLKDWYPFSKHVTEAELKIGDSYYHLEKYDDAIGAYEEFADLHPGNEARPYVIYQIGRCYFDRMATIDRDQTFTHKALETFRQLRLQYPDSIYAERAGDHVNRCLKNLAANEFYIARFYFKSKRYQAALRRFQAVVTEYPDVGIHREAMQYIAKCEARLAPKSSTP